MELEEGNARRSSSIADLPCTVITNILARLPMKNYVSCRRVCKLWYSLMSESYFHHMCRALTPTIILLPLRGLWISQATSLDVVQLHGSSGITKKKQLLRHYKKKTTPSPWLLRHYKKKQPHGSSGITKKKLRFDQHWGCGRCPLTGYHLTIGNFCNGLISLFDGDCVCIWNPIQDTKKWIRIGLRLKLKHEDKILWGLGLSRMNEYKVIWMYKRTGTERLQAEILTLGLGSYLVRDIGEVPYLLNLNFIGAYLNGAIHWIVDDHVSELICCFDLATEKFRLLPPPPAFYTQINNEMHPWKKKRYTWSNLGVLEDCLYICASDAVMFNPPIEIWVMKGYGQQESWVQMFEIKNPVVEWWSRSRHLQIIKVTAKGQIIMLCGDTHLLSYDQRTRTHKALLLSSFDAIAFVTSFASPKRHATQRWVPHMVDIKET